MERGKWFFPPSLLKSKVLPSNTFHIKSTGMSMQSVENINFRYNRFEQNSYEWWVKRIYQIEISVILLLRLVILFWKGNFSSYFWFIYRRTDWLNTFLFTPFVLWSQWTSAMGKFSFVLNRPMKTKVEEIWRKPLQPEKNERIARINATAFGSNEKWAWPWKMSEPICSADITFLSLCLSCGRPMDKF